MTTGGEMTPRGKGRVKKLLAMIAAVFIASVALTVPAWGVVRPDKTLTVFHEIDMVAATGYVLGSPVTVEVLRGGQVIGTATGPAIDTPDGPGLEVNHGPEGDPQPGDCWEGFTPDILPGDEVRIIGDGGTDTTVVADVRFTSGPTPQSNGDIVLTGVARDPDGGALPLDELAGELRQQTPRYRAAPNSIQPITGTVGGWRAIYRAPYNVVQNPTGLTLAQQRQAILGGDHSMTFGVANDIQIADNGLPGGPAPGCEAAPWSRNAVTSFDDAAINLASGSLVARGQAMAGTTSADVTLRDGNPATPDVTKPAVLSGDGPRTWSVTFLRGEIHPALADGAITASVVATPVGGGVARTIRKDTVAPTAPRAAPRAGIYQRPQSVRLRAQVGTRIHFTQGGATPTPQSRVFAGPIRVTATQTIKAISVDAAGNRSPVASFRYVIR